MESFVTLSKTCTNWQIKSASLTDIEMFYDMWAIFMMGVLPFITDMYHMNCNRQYFETYWYVVCFIRCHNGYDSFQCFMQSNFSHLIQSIAICFFSPLFIYFSHKRPKRSVFLNGCCEKGNLSGNTMCTYRAQLVCVIDLFTAGKVLHKLQACMQHIRLSPSALQM